MYNKRKFNKINDKKVLHKVKKQWVTISLALLMMIGGGAVATHVSANADANNNTQPVVAMKTPAKRMARKATPVSSSASTNQPSQARTNQMSAYSKYSSDVDELTNIVNGQYAKVNWTPSMMDAYTAIVVASDEDYKDASAFNANSTASNATNFREYSMASSAASSANMNVDYEESAFASNYSGVAGHLEHEPLVDSYIVNSLSASGGMEVQLANEPMNTTYLKPFASLSNSYNSDMAAAILLTSQIALPDAEISTNDNLRNAINYASSALSLESGMASLGSEAGSLFSKLPSNVQSSYNSYVPNADSEAAKSQEEAHISANSAVQSESAFATHMTSAQIQSAASSAVNSYDVQQLGTPNQITNYILTEMSESENEPIYYSESASASQSASQSVSASNSVSTRSAINSYLATLSGFNKSYAEHIISGMDNDININNATNESLSSSFASSTASIVSSAESYRNSYIASYNASASSLDSSLAISTYNASTGNSKAMTPSLASTVVSNFNNSLLANSAMTIFYGDGSMNVARNNLLYQAASNVYNMYKVSLEAKYPNNASANASSAASSTNSSKASSSVVPSSANSSSASKTSSASAKPSSKASTRPSSASVKPSSKAPAKPKQCCEAS